MTPGHVVGDTRPGYVDTKFEQLTMNAWRAPKRVVAADHQHVADEHYMV
jgi:hypothetical protein